MAYLQAMSTEHQPRLTIIIPCAAHDNAYTLTTALSSALPHADHYVISAASRAAAMNEGAEKAQKNGAHWLWFLHTDSTLPKETLEHVGTLTQRMTDEPEFHAFSLIFSKPRPRLMGLNTLGANLRSQWLKLPFGDQGYLMNILAWDALKPYDETLPCAEDLMMVRTAKQRGIIPIIHKEKIMTSARKYEKNTWLKTTLLHLHITFFDPRFKSRFKP